MNIIAVVLKSGGQYGKPDALRLIRNIRSAEVCMKDKIVVLSDYDFSDVVAPEVSFVPLLYNLPSWWSKIELFRPGLFEGEDNIVYLDLDTIVLQDFSRLFHKVRQGGFWMLPDPQYPELPASGIMGFRPTYFTQQIFDTFMMNPTLNIRDHQELTSYGDQGFIRRVALKQKALTSLNPLRMWELERDGLQTLPITLTYSHNDPAVKKLCLVYAWWKPKLDGIPEDHWLHHYL